MRVEGLPLDGRRPLLLSDVVLTATCDEVGELARLAAAALAAAEGPPPPQGGPWPPVVGIGEVRGVLLAVDFSGASAEAEAMARLAELGLDPPWLQGDLAEGAAPYASAAFPLDCPDELEGLGDALRDAVRRAAPGLEVDDWWGWYPPGLVLYADLPVPEAGGGVEKELSLHVFVSALAPYCCAFCRRTLSIPSANTAVLDFVESGSSRAAADAACAALGGLGYRRLSLRQAMRPVGPPNAHLGHGGPTTLFDALFGPHRDPYGMPRVVSRFDSAL